MAKPVTLSHPPFPEEWALQVVGTPACGGVGTLSLPPPALLCHPCAHRDIRYPKIHFLPSQFSLLPTKGVNLVSATSLITE